MRKSEGQKIPEKEIVKLYIFLLSKEVHHGLFYLLVQFVFTIYQDESPLHQELQGALEIVLCNFKSYHWG